ncbi:MAG: Crp/Fnr family transcriptional regulator [Flavisolibacter sp.]
MKQDPKEVLQHYRSVLASYCAFSLEAWELLEAILEIKNVSKGELTLQEGKICRFIDFIHVGSFRTFYLNDGLETTTAIAIEGVFVTDMKSLSAETPSNLNIQSLETAIVVRLHKEKLINLYKQSAELQTVGRALLESMVIAENEWKEMYTLYDPQKRYTFLMQKAPEFFVRVPLQYIASFLGIRRETLSRMRSRRS